MIKWVDVRSSAINKIGYESSTHTMYIDFNNSDPHYPFCNVPEEVFKEFVNASSAGRYYHDHIKDRYEC